MSEHGAPVEPGESRASLDELVEVMARLRRECAWKAGQTHQSLVRYLLEETYEVVDAIENGDDDDLREELGDLLLQIVFHAAIAEQEGRFDLDDVAAGLVAKLRRRNPHVFGPGNGAADPNDPVAINEQWEQIKAEEKRARARRAGLATTAGPESTTGSLMDGVPEQLPALLLALKALERLERTGGQGVPVADGGSGIGDRLLVLVEEARRDGLDPEQELRAAVRRAVASGGD